MIFFKTQLTIIFLFIVAIFFNSKVYADQIINYKNKNEKLLISKNIGIFEDKSAKMTFQQIRKLEFKSSQNLVPSFPDFRLAYWVKFKLKNSTDLSSLHLEIAFPNIDSVDLYAIKPNGAIIISRLGKYKPFNNRFIKHQNYIFPLKIEPNATDEFYLRLKSSESFQLPMYVSYKDTLLIDFIKEDLFFGIYIGIILIMAIYNLFIYFSTKDNSYIYYVMYIIFVGLSQFTLQGYSFKYLWPNNTWLAQNGGLLIYAASGITTVAFIISFLQTKKVINKAHQVFKVLIVLYIVIFISVLVHSSNYTMIILQIIAIFGSIFTFIVAIILYRKNYRPAKFLIIAWSVFLIALCVFALRNFNILPYNNITLYFLPVGSAIEVALLSFALADKINIYRNEKEQSQQEVLLALQENERIIKEQNINLERKVIERTVELQASNNQLNGALKTLRDTQSQLVDAEKMASLGQLTAGIAHEINNPINFVTSNIKPLELDINDLRNVISKYENIDINGDIEQQFESINQFKRQIDINYVNEEISTLLNGIDEGARRTAEIIRGLKNFSRLDENDTKPVDLNEGLDSTIMLIRSSMPSNIKIVKEYGSIPLVDCLPGKINQVFMNLISNAVQAIKYKEHQNNDESVHIKSWQDGNKVKISIKDTGTGMTDEVKNKIFEPFFTTKAVGEGTGLGLSIVFRIVETHHGTIEVLSKLNVGTEFILTLPTNKQANE